MKKTLSFCHPDGNRPLYALLAACLLFTTLATAQTLQTEANPNTAPPTLYEISHAPTNKTLFIFQSPRQAKTWTTIGGFALIATGAYLGGKAEMHRMYHGTTDDWDTFHVTRDASIFVTGIGCASVGASVVIGERIKPWEFIWKTAAGALIYRGIAQWTYNTTKPD